MPFVFEVPPTCTHHLPRNLLSLLSPDSSLVASPPTGTSTLETQAFAQSPFHFYAMYSVSPRYCFWFLNSSRSLSSSFLIATASVPIFAMPCPDAHLLSESQSLDLPSSPHPVPPAARSCPLLLLVPVGQPIV